MHDAIRQAVRLVADDPARSIGVWQYEGRTFVDDCRNKTAPVDFMAVVERWDDNTVQVRTAGGNSEWVKV